MLHFERELWNVGIRTIAGVDEAGRGPLAGPVVAAAVIFPPDTFLEGVDDSKKLSPSRRDDLYTQIVTRAVAIGVGIVDHAVIDRMNILNATLRAMTSALDQLAIVPEHVLIDGNRVPPVGVPCTSIVHGDARSFTIAAASIVAKVTRDRLMIAYDREYPGYGFARHKGYGTRAHREAIARLGQSPIHRLSFSWSPIEVDDAQGS